jgi:hypothetical protein
MTAAFDPIEAALLVATARYEYELVAKQGYGVRAGTTHALADQLEAAAAEVGRLAARRDELLALAAKLTRETPYPAELEECRSARRALIAEVGTLRATTADLDQQRTGAGEALVVVTAALAAARAEVANMRPVVEAAAASEDAECSGGPLCDHPAHRAACQIVVTARALTGALDDYRAGEL